MIGAGAGGDSGFQDAMSTLSDKGHGTEGRPHMRAGRLHTAGPRQVHRRPLPLAPTAERAASPTLLPSASWGRGMGLGEAAGSSCPPEMLPARWQESLGVRREEQRRSCVRGQLTAQAADLGKQVPSPARVRSESSHYRPWTSSLGVPCSRKVPIFSNNYQSLTLRPPLQRSWSENQPL